MNGIKNMAAAFHAWRKKPSVRLAITLAAVFISALVQTYAIQVFVRRAGIISGGFTGLGMLVERLGELKGINIPLQAVLLLLNTPWCRSPLPAFFFRSVPLLPYLPMNF